MGKKQKNSFGGRTKTTWKKGIRSPNPLGPPRKGETWRDLVDRIGREDTIDEEGKKMPWRERVVRAAYKNACVAPAPAYWKELMDRSGEDTPPEEMLDRIAEKYGIAKEDLAKDAGITAILRALGTGSAD